MSGHQRQRLILWAPVALLVVFQGYLSAQSSLPGIPIPGPNPDKTVHFLYFFLMGSLSFRAARYGERWTGDVARWVVVTGGLVWGLLDELHQSFTPNRTADYGDVLADLLGAVVAVLVTEPFWSWLNARFGRVSRPVRREVAGGQGVEPQ